MTHSIHAAHVTPRLALAALFVLTSCDRQIAPTDPTVAPQIGRSASELDRPIYLVMFPYSTPDVTALTASLERQFGFSTRTHFESVIKGFSAHMSPSIAAELERLPGVIAVTANVTGTPAYVPYTQQSAPWHLDRLDQRTLPLDSAFSHTYEDLARSVHAYIIDSRIDDHADFGGASAGGSRILFGFDITAGGSGDDGCNHGTPVASAAGGDSVGVAKRVTLHNVKVWPTGGDCVTLWIEDVMKGLEWVGNNHQHPAVANLSVQFSPRNPVLDSAVRHLVQVHDVPVVVSAGNSGEDACNWSPAGEPLAITVGASTRADAPMEDIWAGMSSNWGSCLDLWAPGQEVVLASYGGQDFTPKTGTSYAAPQVVGVAATYLSRFPKALPQEVRDRIVALATDKAIDPVTSHTSPSKLLYSRWVVDSIVGPNSANVNDVVEFSSDAQGGRSPYDYMLWYQDGALLSDCSGYMACFVQTGGSDFTLRLETTDAIGVKYTAEKYVNVF